MQGRHIPLLILLAVAVVAGGCTAPDTVADLQSDSPAPPQLLTLAQTLLGGLPAPTPAAPPRENTTLEVRKVAFVDPRTYQIPTPTPTITMTKQPNDLRVSERMVDYATATIDRPPRVLATEVYRIPYPYWAVNVSVTPMNDYSWLAMEIYEKSDPNKIVREIQYSRSDLARPGNVSTKDNSTESGSARKEETFTIREGYGDYYFIIRSESLKSLTITVKVPEKYLV
ncbi:hypothetical protein F8E02_03575 [Methanoculleus sp. Wushi-C6]|uniref:Lipoprotein n=1 Tax=Methanoculleus caldifontis TaxID=2651577 RepID=A0ABU3WZ71_9EURY|nr:hypothetical protein [Methanoculleus sp. Wushi-C6]MDV2481103.1 hypothetical protein [Methanoculleus sp. Wushi-C6]